MVIDVSEPKQGKASRSHIDQFISFILNRSAADYLINISVPAPDKLRVSIVSSQAFLAESVILKNPSESTLEFDLNNGLPELEDKVLRRAVVVCLGALENVACHDILGKALASYHYKCLFMLITTPDRVRTMSVTQCIQLEPSNVPKGWTAEELGRFLIGCGFPKQLLLGYVSDTPDETGLILVVAGHEALASRPVTRPRVAAIINLFNEADVIEEVVLHLAEQGIEVHLFDDWSTDGSFEICQRLVESGHCRVLSRNAHGPGKDYKWMKILQRAQEYAQSLTADWIMHCDADEIRYSPWPDLTLQDAIGWVDSLGYSAIDFTVMNFFYTNHTDASPSQKLDRFKHFAFGRQSADLNQIKAWRNPKLPVDLASSGGHDVQFSGRRIFPLKFLMKHYPLRSQGQAEAKLFRDRIPRIRQERNEKGWHIHYDLYAILNVVRPWREFELTPYNPRCFPEEFIIERLSGIGIDTVEHLIPSIETVLKGAASFKSVKETRDKSPL